MMSILKKTYFIVLAVIVVVLFAACKSDVSDQNYKIEYNSKTYEGKYTGTMEKGVPQGEGKFVFGNEGDNNYFIYDGSWEAGEMKGKGNLITNNYIVHFPTTDYKEGTDRTGQYNGEVIDGIANGEGKFSATNDEGVSYTYTGSWKDGLFSGEGVRTNDSDGCSKYEGHFENGEFKPTVAEYMQMLGTNESNCPYDMSKDMLKYVSDHSDVFLKHDISTVKESIKDEFSLDKFKKNQNVEEAYYVNLNGLTVHQAWQLKDDEKMFGYKVIETISYDNDKELYHFYYFGDTNKIVEGKRYDAIVLPLGYSTFETTDGGKAWALAGWIVKIE